MLGRSFALVIAAVGGVLILLGGVAAFLLSAARSPGAGLAAGLQGAFLALAITLLLGFLVLLTARPRLFWWSGRRLFNAIVLAVLGLLTWVFVGGFVLTAIGAVLTIVGGIALPIEGLVSGLLGGSRRLFHRRRLW